MDGIVSLIGWLTVFVSDTIMALVEDGEMLGSRQLDMRNSGLTFPFGPTDTMPWPVSARPMRGHTSTEESSHQLGGCEHNG